MTTLTWDKALRFRLRRLGIAPPAGGDVVALVDGLCGVQAQVLSAAADAVAVRGVPAGDLAAALADGRVMRTWTVRGTLHVLSPVAAADQLAVLADARIWEKGAWQKAFAPLRVMDELAAAVDTALADGPLTREELVGAVGRPELAERLRSGWSTLLKPLAWQGILSHGPARGRHVTFARPADLLSAWPGLPDVAEAGPRVLRAYVRAFGPITLEAFDAWLLRGATRKARLRGWRDALADEMATVDVEGREALVLSADVDALRATRPAPKAQHLLPGFDQYVLGPGTDDTAIVPAAHRKRVSRPGGHISPVVVRGGRVVGTWEAGADGPDLRPF